MFFSEFCLTSRIFLVSVLLFALVERFFVSRMRDFYFINRIKRNNYNFIRQTIFCPLVTSQIYRLNIYHGNIIPNTVECLHITPNLFAPNHLNNLVRGICIKVSACEYVTLFVEKIRLHRIC